jgi:hypothetical protein
MSQKLLPEICETTVTAALCPKEKLETAKLEIDEIIVRVLRPITKKITDDFMRRKLTESHCFEKMPDNNLSS